MKNNCKKEGDNEDEEEVEEEEVVTKTFKNTELNTGNTSLCNPSETRM